VILASTSTLGLLALVAAAPSSPLHPLLPAGYEAYAPLVAVSRALGLGGLSDNALAGLTDVSLLAALSAFVFALRQAWRGQLAPRSALGLGIVFQLSTLLLPLLISRDVYSYSIYGRISGVYHQNPYVALPSDFQHDELYRYVALKWQATAPVYGPAFTALTALIARFARTPNQLILAFRLCATLASLGILMLSFRVAERLMPTRAAFAMVLFGWNPAVLVHAVSSGHNDLLVGLAIVGALALLAAGHELWATAALTAGALVKITAALPLLLLIVVAVANRPVASRLRGCLQHAAVGGAVLLGFAIPYAQTKDPTLGLLELAGHSGHLAASHVIVRALLALAASSGTPGVWLALASVVRMAFPLTLLLAFAAIVLHVWRRAAGLSPAAQAAAWAWSLLLLTLLGPVLLPWYMAWSLPIAFVLPRVPRTVAMVMSALFCISEAMAEPLRTDGLFSVALDSTQGIVTLGATAMLVWLLGDLRRRLRDGTPLDTDDLGGTESDSLASASAQAAG
jgi:hypothetical protein